MILVDASVWQELTRAEPHEAVLDFLTRHHDQLWLSVIAIAELRRGIEAPAATPKRDGLLNWLKDIETAFASRILSFDADMAHMIGALQARNKAGTVHTDLQIAAQAISHNMVLATGNIRALRWTGARLLNPWEW